MSKNYKQCCIDVLMELANGASPEDRHIGVCSNVEKVVTRRTGQFSLIVERASRSMAGCDFPFNDLGVDDKWAGHRGHKRRVYAAFLACWLEDEKP